MEKESIMATIAKIGQHRFYCLDLGFSFYDFFDELLNSTPKANNTLHMFAQYGVYDELIPIIEIVHILCPEETKAWVDDIVDSFQESSFVQAMLNEYHSVVIESYLLEKEVNSKLPCDEELWELALSFTAAQTESIIWDCYDKIAFKPLLKDSDKCIGLLIPGLFARTVNASFVHDIGRFTVPAIENAIEYRRNYEPNNTVLTAILKREIRILVFEIAHHYCSDIDVAILNFLHLDVDAVKSMTGGELKKNVFLCPPYDGNAAYFEYDEKWIDALRRICLLSERFFANDKPERTIELLSYIPLLYQLINENELAEKELVLYLREYGYYSVPAQLLTTSIALLKSEAGPNRQFICSCVENCYGYKSEQVKRYVDLISDTIAYFKAYFERINTCISEMGDTVYNALVHDLEISSNLGMDILQNESIAWIHQNMIVGDTFIKLLNDCRERILTARYPLIDADEAFKQSLSLFFSVSSHIDNCPRINTQQYLRVFHKSDSRDAEVFYDDAYYDNQEHKALYRRFIYAKNTFPSKEFSEKAISVLKKLEIEEQAMEDIDFTQEFLFACERISDDPCNYSSAEEDGLNRHVRDMLDASLFRLGYAVCDQTQQGLGRGRKKAGEVDIRINKNGRPVALYEGLMHVNRQYLYDHISKVIDRYNPSGCSKAYVVEFSRNQNFMRYWKKTLTYLNEHPKINVAEKKTGTEFVRLCEGDFLIGGATGRIVFIGVRILPS